LVQADDGEVQAAGMPARRRVRDVGRGDGRGQDAVGSVEAAAIGLAVDVRAGQQPGRVRARRSRASPKMLPMGSTRVAKPSSRSQASSASRASRLASSPRDDGFRPPPWRHSLKTVQVWPVSRAVHQARLWPGLANTMVFASAEPVTGNWDPTSHTTLAQINLEGFVFGQLFRTPMRPENPDEIVFELATSQEVIDLYTIEYKLRDGVKFHNGRLHGRRRQGDLRIRLAADPPRRLVSRPLRGRGGRSADRPGAHRKWAAIRLPPSTSSPASCRSCRSRDIADPTTLQERPNGTGPFSSSSSAATPPS
jgi:hypothetical protein